MILSVIIRCKDEQKFIGSVLEKVFQQDFGHPFEVIIIDSGSKDRTLEIVKEYPIRCYKIQPQSFTFGYALNYGARKAQGEHLVFLSAHCIPTDKEWLSNLIKSLQENEEIAATFGRQEPIRELNPFEEIGLFYDFPTSPFLHPKPIFSNANCAIRKIVWEKHPFDEIIPFAEDKLWAENLPPHFKIKYVFEASVYHSHSLYLKYWAKRFFCDGCAEKYISRFWKSQKKEQKNATSSLCEELWVNLNYLLNHHYYKHIFYLPVFIILKKISYQAGFNLKISEKMVAPKVIKW
ncbi:MAG: glycosyltransferase family 2 protein [Candidatus Omnitrophota bacterium]